MMELTKYSDIYNVIDKTDNFSCSGTVTNSNTNCGITLLILDNSGNSAYYNYNDNDGYIDANFNCDKNINLEEFKMYVDNLITQILSKLESYGN